jgi:hypothetical protein
MFVPSMAMTTRAIPLFVHATIEMIAAPAIMIAPFLFGFGVAASVLCVMVGAVLLGLALQTDGSGRVLPLTAHAGFDYLLAFISVAGGLLIGLATGDSNAAIFLVGIGAAMAALTASTRFSAARNA